MTLEYALKCLDFKLYDFIPSANEYNEAIQIACNAIQDKMEREQKSRISVKRSCGNCLWYKHREEFSCGECDLIPGIWVEPDDYCSNFHLKEI